MHLNTIKINNNKINLVFDYKYEKKKKKNINRTKSPESDTAKYLTNPIYKNNPESQSQSKKQLIMF